jgi:membrane-associated phospholipid phosphatase
MNTSDGGARHPRSGPDRSVPAGSNCGRRGRRPHRVQYLPESVLKRWISICCVFLLLPGLRAFAEDSGQATASKQGAPADYTSLKKFPQNLGGNFKALFSKRNIVPFLIGGAATGIVAPFDREIRDHVGMEGDSSTFGKIGGVLGGPAVVLPAVAGLLIGGQYSKNDRFHSFTYSLAQATVINEGLVTGLKFAVGRTRPDGSDNRSFPSGHAATSFMIASVLQRYYGPKAAIIGYSAATFISLSRARENKHWASDLTAGATLGYIVGSSVSRRTGISIRVRKITLIPAINLTQRRVGFFISTDSN